MESSPGWDWWQSPSAFESSVAASDRAALARACLRLLSSADGVLVMDYFKARTLDRCLGPDASDRALWMLEGQRSFVLHILSLAEQGRFAPSL